MRKSRAFCTFAALIMLASCERKSPVLIVGSSCMGRFTQALSYGWKGESEVQLGGTALGLIALSEKRADIAACSREVTEADGEFDCFTVALDAVAVAVNPENGVDSLTLSQLAKIYTGNVTNWSEVGGSDDAIVVIGRESGSGTRSSFEDALKITSPCHGQELPESGMIRTAVASLDNAIGYFSLCDADDSVKVLMIDGEYPSEDSVQNRSYPIVRPFVFCTRKDAGRMTRSFIAFALGPEGQDAAKSLGLFKAEVYK